MEWGERSTRVGLNKVETVDFFICRVRSLNFLDCSHRARVCVHISIGFRLSQIAEKMRKMPQMIADYRQQRKAQKQKSQEKNLKDPTKLLAAIRKKGGTKSQQELEQLLRKHKQKDN